MSDLSDPQDVAEELDEDEIGDNPEENFPPEHPLGIDATGAPRGGEEQYEDELPEDDLQEDDDFGGPER